MVEAVAVVVTVTVAVTVLVAVLVGGTLVVAGPAWTQAMVAVEVGVEGQVGNAE